MEAFNRYLRGLLGAFVQVERGGPEACVGWVVHVLPDYLTVRSEAGEDLHLPLHHIRSITPLPDPLAPLGGGPAPAPPPETFVALLELNQGRYIRLYHAGPEVCSGILREAGPEYVLIEVGPGEIACFTCFHIRSLFVPDPPPGEAAVPVQGR